MIENIWKPEFRVPIWKLNSNCMGHDMRFVMIFTTFPIVLVALRGIRSSIKPSGNSRNIDNGRSMCVSLPIGPSCQSSHLIVQYGFIPTSSLNIGWFVMVWFSFCLPLSTIPLISLSFTPWIMFGKHIVQKQRHHWRLSPLVEVKKKPCAVLPKVWKLLGDHKNDAGSETEAFCSW